MNTPYCKKHGLVRLFAVMILCLVLPLVRAAVGAEQGIHLAFTFDDKAAQENLFSPNPSSQIEWVTNFGRSNNTALKVTHIPGKSYIGAENAVRLTFAEPLPAGGVYNISVWFYVPSADNKNKDTLTGPGVVLNGEYAQSRYKLPTNFGTMPVDQWKEVNVTTPLMEVPLRTIDFRFVVNEERKHPDVWYLDDIVIRQVGELQIFAVPKWDLSLPSLAKTYKDYFLIGNVMSANQTTAPELTAMYKHHYNVMTAENDMKPLYLAPAKGKYNFVAADTLVNWALENGIKVHGHTLVWHSQSPLWLTRNGTLTRAEARENLQEYITNVVGHFRGKVISWDVVNEAFADGAPVISSWKDALRKDSPWYLAYENGADKSKGESGADYIYDAFVFARLADPGATLYYNDYNETDPFKREAMALMAEDLNKKWKTDPRNTQPDRPLVEGLGMQAHYWLDTLNVADVEATIVRFIKAGVRIGISELDIPAGSYTAQRTPPLTKEEELKQARLYAQLFVVFKKYAKYIDRVTFWGKADSQSWRANGSPLLFDEKFAAKQAYYAVIDPEGYLEKHR
ncbi:MAG: endo-1,4-beta-xylanase [Firmicutes bacterium]|nr:endo-1,4-beta-xylanase [Bacillota bacterium]